jgi:hypothetical protein
MAISCVIGCYARATADRTRLRHGFHKNLAFLFCAEVTSRAARSEIVAEPPVLCCASPSAAS